MITYTAETGEVVFNVAPVAVPIIGGLCQAVAAGAGLFVVARGVRWVLYVLEDIIDPYEQASAEDAEPDWGAVWDAGAATRKEYEDAGFSIPKA